MHVCRSERRTSFRGVSRSDGEAVCAWSAGEGVSRGVSRSGGRGRVCRAWWAREGECCGVSVCVWGGEGVYLWGVVGEGEECRGVAGEVGWVCGVGVSWSVGIRWEWEG